MGVDSLSSYVAGFERQKIVVVGDVMVDKLIRGSVDRLSPDAPVPVVHVSSEETVPGGAANVANMIVSLGGNAVIMGVTGEDSAAEEMRKALRDAGVEESLVNDGSRPTTQKIRVVGDHGCQQHIVRVDYESVEHVIGEVEKELLNRLRGAAKGCNVIIISDYDKGVITPELVGAAIKLATEMSIPILVDTKPNRYLLFKGVSLIKPNEKEALEMTGENDICEAGKKLQRDLGCSVLVTRGDNGMALFENDDMTEFPARAKEVGSVVGAGDSVIAAIALSLAAGADLRDAVDISSYVSAIVVEKPGTALCTGDELLERLQNE